MNDVKHKFKKHVLAFISRWKIKVVKVTCTVLRPRLTFWYFSAIVQGRDVLAAGSGGKNTALISSTWRQGAILKIRLQGEMVRVIKLSMKCTLIGALHRMRGRKKPNVSVERGQGSSPRWFPTQVRFAGVALSKPLWAAHTCCPVTELPSWQEKGREEAVDNWAGSWEEKIALLSRETETLGGEASGCIRELFVRGAPVHLTDHTGSSLGSFPAPRSLLPLPARPSPLLRPAEADPSVEFVFQALKTKLLGG